MRDETRKGSGARRRIAFGAAATLVATGLAGSLAPSAFAAQPSAASRTTRCVSAHLTANWVGVDNATQKHYANLVFTNTGNSKCYLGGYPTLTFVDATGAAVGLPATQLATDTQHFVTLAPGGTTTAQAIRLNAEVFSEDLCQIVTTAGISVLPPGSTTAILVPGTPTACSGDIGRSLLDVGPIGTSF